MLSLSLKEMCGIKQRMFRCNTLPFGF